MRTLMLVLVIPLIAWVVVWWAVDPLPLFSWRGATLVFAVATIASCSWARGLTANGTR